MANFVTRAELEGRIGVQRVLDFYDDDHDGVLNDDEVGQLNETLSEASDAVVSALIHKGWTSDQLNGLSRDRGLRRTAVQIAAQLSGERRPEFINDAGEGAYHAQGERGRKTLKEFARGEQRSRLEDANGKNASLRGRVSASDPVTVFGRDPSNPDDKYGDGRGF